MRNSSAARIWLTVGLILPLAWLAITRLAQAFPPLGELNADARVSYLPSARKLLDHPWHFLTADPASYHVAPLGYVWPALWGADQTTIQLANCARCL